MDDPKNSAEKSVLYVVATPIGNLSDMTFRAVDILKSVDVIAAEDTRHTARLLSFFNIRAKLVSCHEHNENQRAEQLINRLVSGQSVALVSNAGTPSVSDPGYRIVKEAVAAGIKVVPLPGASAVVTAISASAMPTDMFCFVGFLPKKKGSQSALLRSLSERRETLVFYESPRRLLPLLSTIKNHMGDRYAVIARELTKIHEEFIRGRISELIGQIEDRAVLKGEVTLLVAGRPETAGEDAETLEAEITKLILKDNLSTAMLAARLAKRYNLSKSDIYQEVIKVKSRMKNNGNGDKKGDFADG